MRRLWAFLRGRRSKEAATRIPPAPPPPVPTPARASAPPPPPPPPPAARPAPAVTADEPLVSLILEDGTSVSATNDRESHEMFRYLARNLIPGAGKSAGSGPEEG